MSSGASILAGSRWSRQADGTSPDSRCGRKQVLWGDVAQRSTHYSAYAAERLSTLCGIYGIAKCLRKDCGTPSFRAIEGSRPSVEAGRQGGGAKRAGMMCRWRHFDPQQAAQLSRTHAANPFVDLVLFLRVPMDGDISPIFPCDSVEQPLLYTNNIYIYIICFQV